MFRQVISILETSMSLLCCCCYYSALLLLLYAKIVICEPLITTQQGPKIIFCFTYTLPSPACILEELHKSPSLLPWYKHNSPISPTYFLLLGNTQSQLTNWCDVPFQDISERKASWILYFTEMTPCYNTCFAIIIGTSPEKSYTCILIRTLLTNWLLATKDKFLVLQIFILPMHHLAQEKLTIIFLQFLRGYIYPQVSKG